MLLSETSSTVIFHLLMLDFVKASNVQNEEWVNFQQSISVQGFNTGQSTTISSVSRGVKNRGGSGMRRRREKEMEMVTAESASVSSNVSSYSQSQKFRIFYVMAVFNHSLF